jgi:hypothetical protein
MIGPFHTGRQASIVSGGIVGECDEGGNQRVERPVSTLLILALILLTSYLLNVPFLWIGAKWARIPGVTFIRALGATLVIHLLSILARLASIWLWSTVEAPLWLAWGLEAGAFSLLTWLVIMALFKTTIGRAFVSWLPTLVPAAATATLIYLLVGPHILAAYIMPTHSMAPTLLGPHKLVLCHTCDFG